MSSPDSQQPSQTAAKPPSQAVPKLREELKIFEGAPSVDGEKTWVMQDPAANRFFQLGQHEYELVVRWNLGSRDAILRALKEAGLEGYTAEDIDTFSQFLFEHNLIQVRGARAIQRLKEQRDKTTKRDFWWLVKNYLFVRIPLVNPDRFLEATLPYIRWTGTRAFLMITVLAGLLGLYLAQRQWEGFLNTFSYFFNFNGLVILVLSITVVKIMHELGHAYVAKAMGCNVPSIGVAFLVMWPVLFTDATDTWRLTSRRQRMLVSGAGMMTEVTLAVYATLLWSFLAPGPAKSIFFMLATTSWIATVLINLNPFMRFDGYYLLSDLIGVPNLQQRGFAYGRWQLREWLFGFGQEPPETFPPQTRRILLFYAYGTWIYRFFLFLGIALLVYHLFFKLLGIFLMAVELVWFIGLPIYREVYAWHKQRDQLTWNIHSMFTSAFVLGGIIVLVFPFQWHISAPSLARASVQSQVFTENAARLDALLIAPGDAVESDQLLFRFASPDLDYEIASAQNTIASLERQINIQNLQRELQERSLVLLQEMASERSRLEALLEERDKLAIHAPTSGTVREMIHPVSEGEWLPAGQPLALITNNDSGMIEGWIEESDLLNVTEGSSGWFYPEDPQRQPFRITVNEIDRTSTRVLDELYLSSTAGGDIPVRETTGGELVPERPVYRVIATPDEALAPDTIVRGTARFEGLRHSLLASIYSTVVSVFIRESGF